MNTPLTIVHPLLGKEKNIWFYLIIAQCQCVRHLNYILKKPSQKNPKRAFKISRTTSINNDWCVFNNANLLIRRLVHYKVQPFIIYNRWYNKVYSCEKCCLLIELIILFYFLSPPLKPSHQTFLFHRLRHIILYHKLMHRLYIHHPIFELIFQQKRIKLRFHFHLNFLFDNKDTVLTEIIINFRTFPLPWAGKNKTDISCLFPGDALRMRNR